jgi:hypothetical protein
MNDVWCAPLFVGAGWISGAAAREARIKAAGGLEAIIKAAAENAARIALEWATRAAEPGIDAKVVPLRKRT